MSGNVILDKRFCYLSINKVVFAEGNTDSVLTVFMEVPLTGTSDKLMDDMNNLKKNKKSSLYFE